MDGSNREIIEYDLLIKNGEIIDGTGKPSFLSDIGIKDGIIKKIGKIEIIYTFSQSQWRNETNPDGQSWT